MKILFPIKLKETGGTSTFARKFKQGMEQSGHEVHFSFTTKYDILLASPRAPLPYLLHAKIRRRPIIHRLDGVYYPGTAAGRFWRFHNLPLRIIRNLFADYVIYQSRFSQRSCEKFLGGSSGKPEAIIYNGVDTNLFSPTGPARSLRDNNAQQVFITASRFRREDQIRPILQAFRIYQEKYEINSKLIIIGDLATALKNKLPPTTGVQFQGPVPNHELPTYYRDADVFLFTHRNPPCPNNVIEAMASGLPICGVADGSMVELTTPQVNSELVRVNNDAYLLPRSLHPTTLADNLHKIMKHQSQYAAAGRKRALQEFRLPKMIQKYVSVFHTRL